MQASFISATCEDLPAPTNGHKSTDNKTEFYIPGDVIDFLCPPGYILNGESRVECQNDGTWSSSSVPECESKFNFVKKFNFAFFL